MQRSLLLLENCINSEETRKQYLYYLSRFISHYSLEDCDSILAVEQKKLVVMIEDYVIYLKKQISPNTLPTYLFALKSFLEINDVNLNWKRIKRLYPAKVKLSGRKAWSTDDIKKMLEFAPDIRAKSIIHFLSSTAARIGSLPDIKLKNVEEMPDNCKSVLIYEGSTEEYYCFLIPESVRILNLYLEKRKKDGEILTPDSPLFRKSYMFGDTKGVPLTKEGIESIIRRIVHNAGLRNDKIGKRYGVQQNHGFRKRAATLLKLNKNVNANSIEKILGHKNGIDGIYFTPSKSELFEQFRNGIVDLTLDDSERVRIENEKLQREKQELERKNSEIEILKRAQNEQIENQKMILDVLKQRGIIP